MKKLPFTICKQSFGQNVILSSDFLVENNVFENSLHT